MTDLSPIASCAKWHPDQPSQIKLTRGVGPLGKPFQRRHCALCQQLFGRERQKKRTLPVGGYGVVRLGWAAPETVP